MRNLYSYVGITQNQVYGSKFDYFLSACYTSSPEYSIAFILSYRVLFINEDDGFGDDTDGLEPLYYVAQAFRQKIKPEITENDGKMHLTEQEI